MKRKPLIMGKVSRCFLCLPFTILTFVLIGTVAVNESPDDIIWRVNENVKPKPLPNLTNMKHRPPELNLDPDTRLSTQLFEGCITVDIPDEKLLSSREKSSKRRVITGIEKQWQHTRIPFEIVKIGLTSLDQEQLNKIVESVLEQVMSVTCLVFAPKRDNDTNWIQFYDGQGCHADLGKKSTPDTPTQISIGEGCDSDFVIMHLLLHGLGFLHEQNRVDRDTYIDVQWDNIIPEYQTFFRRRTFSHIDILSGQYNYNSIMHASRNAYSIGGQATMTAKHEPNKELGGMQLNQLDIMNIKLYFNCARFEWKEWGTWSECSRPCGFGYHRRKRVCGGKPENCKGHSSEFRSCRLARCHPEALDTTFDDDWGAWKPRSENSCNWRRGRSRGRKQPTGPQVDHTTGTGRFAQVKYSEACQKDVHARIRTDRLPPSPDGRCLSFVYYLQGDGVGSLEAQMKELTSFHGTTVWTRQGDQGKGWHQATVFIPHIPFSYQLFLVATIGEPGVSDISVDDIYIDNGKCPEGLSKCNDFADKCPHWAAEGECYSNHKWMTVNCCKSCLTIPECVDSEPNCSTKAIAGDCSVKKLKMWSKCCKSCEGCLDRDNRCLGWAEQGECDTNSEWMASNCSKSCKICKG